MAKTVPPLQPLKISTPKDEQESVPPEICLSPSWSDHGEKRRKKERKRMEKEQKEVEKRLKQDRERQRAADIKAGKRLSKKPPPAAMETQKMPSALRRNSWVSMISSQSSSGENTRRSSRDEEKHSGTSLDSTKSQHRSQSTPATSTEIVLDPPRSSGPWRPIVSPAAPKLPNFGWSSHRSSSGAAKPESWASDDSNEKDIISFAYRIESPDLWMEPEKDADFKAQENPTTKAPALSNAPTFSRSVTEPNLMSFMQRSAPDRTPQRPPIQKGDGSEFRSQRVLGEIPGENQYPNAMTNSIIKASTPPSKEDRNETAGNKPGLYHRSSQDPPSPPSRSSHDGSSYVHKQRMYQQQRSIAGFEDEQAVKDANDLAAKSEANDQAAQYETLQEEDVQQGGPGTSLLDAKTQRSENLSQKADASSQSVNGSYRTERPASHSSPAQAALAESFPTNRQPKITAACPPDQVQTDVIQHAQQSARHRTSSQIVRDSISFIKTQESSASKTDKILGFRRRSKIPPTKIYVPDTVQKDTMAVQSARTRGLGLDEPNGKQPKTARTFQDPKPADEGQEDESKPERSVSNQPNEGLPQAKALQNHTRTRTSSSTVLNDSLPSPWPLKDSISQPMVLPPTKNGRQSLEFRIKNEQPGENIKVESPRAKPVYTVADFKSTSSAPLGVPPDTETAPALGVGPKEQKAVAKPTPEIIVESTTGEGLIRKTSITRPRSNPHLRSQSSATTPLPSMDFLPQLKHQPLVKRHPPTSATQVDPFSLSLQSGQSSLTTPDLKLTPPSPLRPSQFPVPTSNRAFNRSSTDFGTASFGKGALVQGMDAKPIAKLFIICCKCKFWHDLPSKLYEAMALPKELHKDEGSKGKGKGKVAEARLETAVKCPWCEHGMTTFCCQGWTTVVYLHERHH